MKLLDEQGVAYRKVDYYKEPFDVAALKRLLRKAGLGPRDVLRKRAPQHKELGLADPGVGDEALLEAIVTHPDLLERPLLEVGRRAVLARPVEKALELLER